MKLSPPGCLSIILLSSICIFGQIEPAPKPEMRATEILKAFRTLGAVQTFDDSIYLFYKDGEVHRYDAEKRLLTIDAWSITDITAVHVTRPGIYQVGTSNGELYINNGKIKVSLSKMAIKQILQTAGSLWVLDGSNSLYRVDAKTGHVISQSHEFQLSRFLSSYASGRYILLMALDYITIVTLREDGYASRKVDCNHMSAAWIDDNAGLAYFAAFHGISVLELNTGQVLETYDDRKFDPNGRIYVLSRLGNEPRKGPGTRFLCLYGWLIGMKVSPRLELEEVESLKLESGGKSILSLRGGKEYYLLLDRYTDDEDKGTRLYRLEFGK
jgi:hypothetical protein